MCGIFCVINYNHRFTPSEKTRLSESLQEIIGRGPDDTREMYITCQNKQGEEFEIYLGFTRLSIIDPTPDGMQPFQYNHHKYYSICNGEIYNYRELKEKYQIKSSELQSDCDCETILPIYEKISTINATTSSIVSTTFINTFINELDAEYAMVIVDLIQNKMHIFRDTHGVRPLFFGYNDTMIGFASEAKVLTHLMDYISPWNPAFRCEIDLDDMNSSNVLRNQIDICKTKNICKYPNNELIADKFQNINIVQLQRNDAYSRNLHDNANNIIKMIYQSIHQKLTDAVKKRLHSDRPVGFFLSGGLDSSLVVSIATSIIGPEKIECFSIGLKDSVDVIAAKKVASFLGIQKHHCVEMTIQEGIDAIPDVIRAIESYDITTIRASTPQYLLSKYISENTDIKVLLSGEGADEIFGSYRYFRDAPNDDIFHWETVRLRENLYMYDNLRSDRTTAGFGLELRVSFLDYDFVNYITSIPPKYKRNSKTQIEKQILRQAFDPKYNNTIQREYLPSDVLYRSKEAFSDAVSSNEVSWYRSIQQKVDSEISDDEYMREKTKYAMNNPESKEAYYYRTIFEQFYKGHDNLIADYWMPRFQKETINDPSATVLKSY